MIWIRECNFAQYLLFCKCSERKMHCNVVWWTMYSMYSLSISQGTDGLEGNLITKPYPVQWRRTASSLLWCSKYPKGERKCRSFCIALACQYIDIDCMTRTTAPWYKYTHDFSLSLPNHPRVENPPILRRKFNLCRCLRTEFPPFQNAVVSAHPGCEEVIAVLRNLCARPECWNMSLLCARMISITPVLRINRIQLPLWWLEGRPWHLIPHRRRTIVIYCDGCNDPANWNRVSVYQAGSTKHFF